MVVGAIYYNAQVLAHYILHAFAVMPNHVHVLITPAVPLSKLTKSLKGITAKRANLMLGRTGSSFGQVESYDHEVRHESEFERIRSYIENNPVPAGLAPEVCRYRCSSAGQGVLGSPVDEASAHLHYHQTVAIKLEQDHYHQVQRPSSWNRITNTGPDATKL